MAGTMLVLILVGGALTAAVLVAQPGPGPARRTLDATRQVINAQVLLGEAVRSGCLRDASPGPRPAATIDLRAARQSLGSVAPELARMSRYPVKGAREVLDYVDALASGEAIVGQDLALWARDREVAGCYSSPTNDLYYERALAEEQALAPVATNLAADWPSFASRYGLPVLAPWSRTGFELTVVPGGIGVP